MAVKLDNSSNRWIRSQSSTVDKELEKKQRIIYSNLTGIMKGKI